MYKASVYVTLKEGVLDAQGQAAQQSLHALHYEEVREVNIGKYIELHIEVDSEEQAQERVTQMCEKLLVNPVIEDYRFDLQKISAGADECATNQAESDTHVQPEGGE